MLAWNKIFNKLQEFSRLSGSWQLRAWANYLKLPNCDEFSFPLAIKWERKGPLPCAGATGALLGRKMNVQKMVFLPALRHHASSSQNLPWSNFFAVPPRYDWRLEKSHDCWAEWKVWHDFPNEDERYSLEVHLGYGWRIDFLTMHKYFYETSFRRKYIELYTFIFDCHWLIIEKTHWWVNINMPTLHHLPSVACFNLLGFLTFWSEEVSSLCVAV